MKQQCEVNDNNINLFVARDETWRRNEKKTLKNSWQQLTNSFMSRDSPVRDVNSPNCVGIVPFIPWSS